MSASARSQFSTYASPQETAFDGNTSVLPLGLSQNHFRASLVPYQSTAHFYQLPVLDRSVHEGDPTYFQALHLTDVNNAYCVGTGISTSTHVNQQTQYNLPSWTQADLQMAPEPLLISSLPTQMYGAPCVDTSQVSLFGFHVGPSGILGDNRTALDPSGNLHLGSSDGRQLTSLANQAVPNFGYHPSLLNSSSPVAHSHFLRVLNDQHAAEPFIPFPSQQLTPSSPHLIPHQPRLAAFLEPDSCLHLVRPHGPSTCRIQGARAIEHGELWLDEQELLASLMETDGKLRVLRCRWEENHFPCRLWIRGDKSSINVHVQRWHGGKPGGDKLEAECRWAGCRAKMLKESIVRHVVSIHVGEMWTCRGCGKEAARHDVYRRHSSQSTLEECRTSGALITYSADVRVVDARAVLIGGGRVPYANADS